MSVLDTMKGATPLVRRVVLCLDGELQAEHDALTTELAKIKPDSLAGDNVARLVKQMHAVGEKMRASEIAFSFLALPWFRRMALEAEHAPRDGNVLDKAHGHNVDTYRPALIRESCRSVQGTDGEVVTDIPDDAWDAMTAGLNYQQVNVLYSAAAMANDNATTVPTSALYLLDGQDFVESSERPGPGTSPRNGSTGGSRPKRRSTSTTKKAG